MDILNQTTWSALEIPFFLAGGGVGGGGGVLYDEVWKVSISWELDELDVILKWPTLKNHRKTSLSFSIYHDIYIKD